MLPHGAVADRRTQATLGADDRESLHAYSLPGIFMYTSIALLSALCERSQGVGKQALSHNSMTARVAPPDTIGLASVESLSRGRADALAWRRSLFCSTFEQQRRLPDGGSH